MIRLTNVNKYFNKKKSNEIHVIDNTSLDLENKGLVTFLGNSGCGKTTLLNAIGGLDRVDSGEIFIDDAKITTKSNGKKDEIRNIHVGYIFQNYNLMEDETVFDNVALVLKMMGVTGKEEIEERVLYILEKVGIERYKNRPAKMLSGGERQRVGIARAIVKNPKIIIADEPTGNLDSRNTIEIMNIIKAISREKLVILVTHEREIADFYASRIIELVDGRIVSDKENVHNDDLDYRLENKIYLQDMPVQKEMMQDKIRVKYYGDQEELPLEVKIIVKNNNIYVQTDGNLSEGSQAMELVDDHYKKISKDIYEEYEFDYAKMIDDNFKPRYTSIYGFGTMMISGYKKIFSYSIIKKILLIGFILASMFVIYSVSNIAGITNVTNDKFLSTNENYLTINAGKVTPELLARYENMDGIDYALPGNAQAVFDLPIDDYYQSAGGMENISGALADQSMVKKEQLLTGKMVNTRKEIVLDKTVVDQLFEANLIQQIGVSTYSDIVGRTVENQQGKFTIVGVADTGSPCIYAEKSMFLKILSNAAVSRAGAEEAQQQAENTVKVLSWAGIKNKGEVKLVGGTLPGDGQVLVNENYRYEKAIGATVDTKINGKKLTVSGYYSDKRQGDNLYVSEKMAKHYFIESQKDIVVSPSNKSKTYNQLMAQNVRVTDNYQIDKEKYEKSISKQVFATVLMALIIMVISLIEIYLMLRSSFLSRVKEVGVLRAIGLKKKDIYKMFAGEIIALTTLTAIPAMGFMAYVLNGVSKIPMVGKDYLMNPTVFLGSLAIVFIFNLIAGLLPVFNTTRKTPAEILSRNDVN